MDLPSNDTTTADIQDILFERLPGSGINGFNVTSAKPFYPEFEPSDDTVVLKMRDGSEFQITIVKVR